MTPSQAALCLRSQALRRTSRNSTPRREGPGLLRPPCPDAEEAARQQAPEPPPPPAEAKAAVQRPRLWGALRRRGGRGLLGELGSPWKGPQGLGKEAGVMARNTDRKPPRGALCPGTVGQSAGTGGPGMGSELRPGSHRAASQGPGSGVGSGLGHNAGCTRRGVSLRTLLEPGPAPTDQCPAPSPHQ